jgi:HAD superfamily hydrolase (TIGR01490 family)
VSSSTTIDTPASGAGSAPRTRGAAFFDLDRTLVSGSSGFSILIEMARAGIVSRRQLVRDTWVSARFRLWGLDDATTDAVRLRVSGYVTGVPTSDLEAISSAVMDRVLPRIYPEVLARAHAHQRAGEPVYLVTASSQEFADRLAEALELDGAVGTRSEIIDGRYTGKPGGPFIYGEGKVQAMEEIATEHGLSLEASTAYSDSISDLPMLRAVGRPVAVNPDRALREIAVREGWEVLALDHLARRAETVAKGLLALVVGVTVVTATRRRATRP